MRRTAFVFLLLLAVVLATHDASAKEMVTCTIRSKSLGKITGRGPSTDDAYQDAAEKCFDQARAKFQSSTGRDFDESTGVSAIDACVNVTCG